MRSSLDLSKEYNMEHFTIVRAIKKYKKSFEKLGKIKQIKKAPSSKGGPATKLYLLNDKQVMFLITLFKNDINNLKHKLNLVKKIGVDYNEED